MGDKYGNKGQMEAIAERNDGGLFQGVAAGMVKVGLF